MAGINLHLYPSTIQFESRMMRMTASLRDAELFERIDLVGITGPDLPLNEEVDGTRRIVRLPLSTPLGKLGGPGRLLQLLAWNRAIHRRYRHEEIAAVNPHIVWALPAASWLSRDTGCPIVYDTHELETETIGSVGLRQKLSRFLEERFIEQVAAVHVVSDGIEYWYRQRYGLDNVHTIKNYPLRQVEIPRTRIFREKFGIPDEHLIFCYQGRLSRVAEVDMLLEVFRALPSDKHLVFMGFGPLEGYLQEQAAATANLHFHPGVPFEEVQQYTGSADAALVLFDDACLSYHHVLPNKLLESLSAGVPVLVSNLPEMVAEIRADDAGWVIPHGPGGLQELIEGLDRAEVSRKKEGAENWSRTHYWSQEADRMLAVYRDLPPLARPQQDEGK